MNAYTFLSRIIKFIIVLISFLSHNSFSQELSGVSDELVIKRGETLVLEWGCNTCHSPKVFTVEGQMQDPRRLMSGHPSDSVHPEVPYELLGTDKWGGFFTPDLTSWAGYWGVSFAANLTPDKKTGIGNWTEEDFINTMKTGKRKGTGRKILPPMPIHQLAQLPEEDLKSIYAYLMSLKPIENKVPEFIAPKDK
ncbi:MAG: cytochrome c [Candidatus Dadabacteria bacterium]|nr:cytochrome c [Candidatus Dadabacteria bacterium]NIS09787.1 cytochrome c [Candidatus Dadabacteria bacterium]NIV41143.1 c-type cytochrome [Candidatus Dadabacteria bacterium]NIX16228.1 c-type cytochrome [Candidatus Dadabacteria bacterium]NIY22848.1 c-type cytochrome [Candidatus Dadabacteria bacterium]